MRACYHQRRQTSVAVSSPAPFAVFLDVDVRAPLPPFRLPPPSPASGGWVSVCSARLFLPLRSEGWVSVRSAWLFLPLRSEGWLQSAAHGFSFPCEARDGSQFAAHGFSLPCEAGEGFQFAA